MFICKFTDLAGHSLMTSKHPRRVRLLVHREPLPPLAWRAKAISPAAYGPVVTEIISLSDNLYLRYVSLPYLCNGNFVTLFFTECFVVYWLNFLIHWPHLQISFCFICQSHWPCLMHRDTPLPAHYLAHPVFSYHVLTWTLSVSIPCVLLDPTFIHIKCFPWMHIISVPCVHTSKHSLCITHVHFFKNAAYFLTCVHLEHTVYSFHELTCEHMLNHTECPVWCVQLKHTAYLCTPWFHNAHTHFCLFIHVFSFKHTVLSIPCVHLEHTFYLYYVFQLNTTLIYIMCFNPYT